MARFRERSIPHSSPTSHIWVSKPGGIVTGSWDYDTTWSDLDSIEDVEVPRFKSRSREGEIFVNPMKRHTSKAVVSPRSWKSEGKAGKHTASIQTFGVPQLSMTEALQDEILRLEQLAVTDAFADVGSPTLAVLTELAEIRETLSFLYSPVKGLIKATKRAHSYVNRYSRWRDAFNKRTKWWESLPAYKRARIPRPEKTNAPRMNWGKFEVTDVSSLWLAYRYAVMPLVYSFQDAQELLENYKEPKNPKRLTARAKEKSTSDDTVYSESVEPPVNDTGYGQLHYRDWQRTELKIEARAGVLYVPEWSLQTAAGIRINRVPAALYEAIPLSFVTDWFHNGAAFYDALTAEFRAQKILGAWVATTIDYTLTYDWSVAPASGTSFTTTEGGERSTVAQNIGRLKLRRPASVENDVKLMLRTKLSAKRIVDGLALSHVLLDAAIRKGK